MDHRKFGDTYILRIDKGEEILEAIRTLCKTEDIALASVSGIGAVNDITLGVFNTEKFCYESNRFTGDYEISSCVGTATRMEGEPYLHIHMTIGNPIQGTCFAGHLNAAVVSLTGEFVIRQIDGRVGRKYSPEVGLNLFEFEEHTEPEGSKI